jgi:hypothetical protein
LKEDEIVAAQKNPARGREKLSPWQALEMISIAQVLYQRMCTALYQSRAMTCQMKPMDFFVWQGRSRELERHAARRRSGTGLQAGVRAAGAGGVNSHAIHDECNAARRKKTRFPGALWLGIGISARLAWRALKWEIREAGWETKKNPLTLR